jgi:hypothetical protein
MSYIRIGKTLSLFCAAALGVGCAALTPDPRNPGPVEDSPVLLRVCIVDDDGAHVVVGDQVELTTDGGRLRIRHIPGPDNRDGAWNGGEAVKVRSAILVERVAPRGNESVARRFVPVGTFTVEIGAQHAAKFDIHASKVTERLTGSRFRECDADVGDDEMILRGVPHNERHAGHVHLRSDP